MSLVDRWRIARCIDEGREFSPGLSRRVRASRALSEYCSNLKRVERTLREGTPPVEPARPGLAIDVETRIRAGEREARIARRLPRAAGVAAAGILLVGVGLVALRPAAKAPEQAARLDSVWTASASMVRTPVEEPLVREARLLARDTKRATDMVLASFPSTRPTGR